MIKEHTFVADYLVAFLTDYSTILCLSNSVTSELIVLNKHSFFLHFLSRARPAKDHKKLPRQFPCPVAGSSLTEV